ncbi:AAC(3) family N-acetyltransferase [Geomonas sp. RF6]|uniref:AAC(3) family N-acetyltransferase n=1 Tax=Geomonas sp. RF6 TaxID=2897342 RepID=UPI001E2AAB38|nr:AAC(3) family N-acetyltransferase [Geomonas sp. RF6]UFS69148.1 AAC(3) family N-acetyltransferase [Geomonas sp. RF6]
MTALVELKRRLFPKGVRKELEKLRNRLFNRCTEEKLVQAFRRLQIPPGAYICVHSMLSGLGYLVGGPEMVIRALQRSVPGCTIMMPSFPFSGSAKDYLDLGQVFDVQRTPSRSGLLTECLRHMPGAVRGLHPTHPCVALGPGAHELIDGTEHSATPFGDDSAYGRFCEKPDAYLLLIHTNNTSILHRTQEMVDMPNLFLDEPFHAKSLLPGGEVATFTVRLHTPVLPLAVLEEDDGGDKNVLWYPDYMLLFPGYNYQRIWQKLRGNSVWERLRKRHESFIERGIYAISGSGGSEIMSVRVAPWMQEINRDLRQNLESFPLNYDRDFLVSMEQEGRLVR